MDYIKLRECAVFSDLRTKHITLDNYITTDNMLPNKGGVTKATSLPNVKTAKEYKKNDILLSNIRPYFKKIWLSDRDGSCSNDVLVIRNKEGFLPEYIYYVLSDNNFFNYDTLTSKGTKMPRGTKNAIMKYLVPRFDLHKQKRITNHLVIFDKLIDNNKHRIRLLEQMAIKIYKEWFVRFRFPGYKKAECETGFPQGWEELQIRDLTQLKSGYAFKSKWFCDEGNCVAKIKDIGDIVMDTLDLSYVSEENCAKAWRFILNEGDLTIALTGATIGKISIVPKNDIPIYTNQRLGKFFNGEKPIERIPYLYCFFSQPEITQTIINLSNSSSAQPNISPDQIEKIRFVSNRKLIDLFNKQTSVLFEQILNLHYRNEILIKQRDLLIPRLITGELEV